MIGGRAGVAAASVGGALAPTGGDAGAADGASDASFDPTGFGCCEGVDVAGVGGFATWGIAAVARGVANGGTDAAALGGVKGRGGAPPIGGRPGSGAAGPDGAAGRAVNGVNGAPGAGRAAAFPGDEAGPVAGLGGAANGGRANGAPGRAGAAGPPIAGAGRGPDGAPGALKAGAGGRAGSALGGSGGDSACSSRGGAEAIAVGAMTGVRVRAGSSAVGGDCGDGGIASDLAGAGATARGAAARGGKAPARSARAFEGANSSSEVVAGAMVITPPHTEHRARTDTAGILAGSTRNTDRHSGQETFTRYPPRAPPSAIPICGSLRPAGCLSGDRSSTPIPEVSSHSSSFLWRVR